ncbi:hypothetical protein LZ578_08215 [Jeotgalibaca sp. MA1X17-3]|uniref:hypothetical protein n=1 Tax=Jeotgalibaca sp. MA1X17-3 TaxID=2908211 RepID=UPI001F1F9DF9|nr:hypothetical protein [Jeotgalibaca sp. MA1X17-3]UJF14990.1 hypothetical protein LZ578_08215 [Jeotgalibaca sp. MA1X17-3]
MKKYTRSYLRSLLKEYPSFDRTIAKRKETFFYPDVRKQDENVGGGKGSFISNPVETVGIKIVDDKEILMYERHKEAIEESINQLQPTMQTIIKKRYFENLNQNAVVKELGVTIAFIRISEEQCLKTLCRSLGLME